MKLYTVNFHTYKQLCDNHKNCYLALAQFHSHLICMHNDLVEFSILNRLNALDENFEPMFPKLGDQLLGLQRHLMRMVVTVHTQ